MNKTTKNAADVKCKISIGSYGPAILIDVKKAGQLIELLAASQIVENEWASGLSDHMVLSEGKVRMELCFDEPLTREQWTSMREAAKKENEQEAMPS